MTPKEKAVELKEKMSVIHYYKLGGKNEKSKGLPVSMHKSQIIQCALNCVEEILNALDSTDCTREFWYSVEHEINKL